MDNLLVNLRHLRALQAVAREGGFSAAARALHLSQPAVTQAVTALERYFAASLFERSAQGAIATAAGHLCIERINRAMQHLKEGMSETLKGATDDSALRLVTATQLHALLTVMDEGGFGAAARAKGLSRGAVHAGVRTLELSTGISLFEKTSNGLQPTRDAQRLARATRLAAAELSQAQAELAALSGVDRGKTVIGAMPLARSLIVPRALLRFSENRPGHVLSLMDGAYESLLRALQRGMADILIGALRESAPADVVQERLFDDPLALIVRTGHPLAALTDGGVKPPKLSDLARFPWIAARADAPLRRHFERLQESLSPRCAIQPIECNSLVAARGLLLGSDRVMLLSAHQVRFELDAGQLLALPHPFGRVSRAIGLTTRRNWRPTQAQTELLSGLRASSVESLEL